VYGEVIDALHQGRKHGIPRDDAAWAMERHFLEHLEKIWRDPDEGLWEVRGAARHFTHSKIMAWVAFDRMVKSVERLKLDGPVDRWRALRRTIHDEVCRSGYDSERNTFVQYYGGKDLDASLLMVPLVGFLPPHDHRVGGTVAAIERELMRDGFVLRYHARETIDGLPPGEGVFLPCTFWLADNYALLGRRDDGVKLFERLLKLCNDVGLISEEYDPSKQRLVGNFPQAFTHVSLINTAMNLSRGKSPANDRKDS
jgi:GH15 family glucan-1,4-alpha-glucosidase